MEEQVLGRYAVLGLAVVGGGVAAGEGEDVWVGEEEDAVGFGEGEGFVDEGGELLLVCATAEVGGLVWVRE